MNRFYGPPQKTLKYGTETRIVASCYTYKGRTTTWLHPEYPQIYARDIARPRQAVLDSAPND